MEIYSPHTSLNQQLMAMKIVKKLKYEISSSESSSTLMKKKKNSNCLRSFIIDTRLQFNLVQRSISSQFLQLFDL